MRALIFLVLLNKTGTKKKHQQNQEPAIVRIGKKTYI